jgi:hypothetical protein
MEHGVVLEKNSDRILMHVPGSRKNKYRVPFTNTDTLFCKNKRVTHNHPFDKCFSIGDIRWACQFEPAELRVATAPNQKVFSMIPVNCWNHEYWLSKCVPELNDYISDQIGMKFDIDKYSRCHGWPFENCYECWMHKACYKAMGRRNRGANFYYKLCDICNIKMEECAI